MDMNYCPDRQITPPSPSAKIERALDDIDALQDEYRFLMERVEESEHLPESIKFDIEEFYNAEIRCIESKMEGLR